MRDYRLMMTGHCLWFSMLYVVALASRHGECLHLQARTRHVYYDGDNIRDGSGSACHGQVQKRLQQKKDGGLQQRTDTEECTFTT